MIGDGTTGIINVEDLSSRWTPLGCELGMISLAALARVRDLCNKSAGPPHTPSLFHILSSHKSLHVDIVDIHLLSHCAFGANRVAVSGRWSELVGPVRLFSMLRNYFASQCFGWWLPIDIHDLLHQRSLPARIVALVRNPFASP